MAFVEILIAENSIPLDAAQADFLRSYLPPTMVVKAGRFRRWQDAQAYLMGKFMLGEGLKKYGFSKGVLDNIQYTEYGRPYLRADVDFNIAHSGKYVVCAITKGLRLGIDIEEIQPIDLGDFTSQFTPEELQKIACAVDSYHEFYRLWTIKEAVIKADGRGLSFPLKDILIDIHARVEEKQWYIHTLDVAAGYAAHLAVDGIVHQEIIAQCVSIP
jgi:4'-phosphopantetheinyl transferase